MILSVRTIAELLLQGRTHEDITRELYALDQRVFPGMVEMHAGVPEVWVDLLRYYQPDYRVMVGNGRLVGYWHVAPLIEASFEKLLQGQLADGEIEIDDVQMLDQPGDFDLYFLVVATEPECRGRQISPLVEAFARYLLDKAEQGVFFRRLCANAFSPEGERLCRRAGMLLCSSQDGGGLIFKFETRDLIARLGKLSPELGRLYKQHFAI